MSHNAKARLDVASDFPN